MEVGKKNKQTNHLHLISGMILNRNQSFLMRMTMYLLYTFTGEWVNWLFYVTINNISVIYVTAIPSQELINVHIRSEQNPYEIKYV